MNLQQIRQKFERKKGRRDQVVTDLKETVRKRKDLESEILISEKAQAIIIAVAKATQDELTYRITEPVSLALAAVYDNPYRMSAEFKIAARGTTECYLNFERNGHLINPFAGAGGGPIDVASFSLRVGSWSLAYPRSRAFLGLDEPFKWVQRDKIPLAAQMLLEVSKEMPLQIIMVSHFPELIEGADRIIWQEDRNKDNKDTEEVDSFTKFAGDLKSFVEFLLEEKEMLKDAGKRPTKYQKHLYNYFLG